MHGMTKGKSENKIEREEREREKRERGERKRVSKKTVSWTGFDEQLSEQMRDMKIKS